MRKHVIAWGLLAVLGFTSSAVARDRGFCCCDPMPAQIQAMCCQGTLLPYHVSLKRADDATKAETALAQLVQERDKLHADLAKAQADEVRHAAERESSQMRRGADRYAHDVLSNLENSVGKVLSQVERGRSELEHVEKDLAPATMRDKVKAL